MTVRYAPPLGLGDGKLDTSPEVIRTQQQWEETFKNCLGLVVVEIYPPWAAPSSALANAVRRIRPQVETLSRKVEDELGGPRQVPREPLQAVAMPSDLAKNIFRLATKPSAGIALACRGRLMHNLPSWDLVGLKKAVLEFFDRGKLNAGGIPLGTQPANPFQTLRADYAAPKLIRNLANAVRSSQALERMRKKMEARDDLRPPTRWQPPQYKSK